MQPHVDPPNGGDETLRRLRAAIEGLGLTGPGERASGLTEEEGRPADEPDPGEIEPAQGCPQPLP
ncbi:MAG: hypothetical protein GEV11_01405 [Streptosporangiales bacterium]|nr:hypothetical protein [Streptosporangiales bacterium]